MLFSCKISNTLLTYLENQGEDISPLLEGTSLPEEFLRDPSYWMQASEMELFLSQALLAIEKKSEQNFMQKIGHLGPELKAWGVLDSVLRMMPRPHDILSQPARFLSYFISPTPPIDNLKRGESNIDFDIAVSAEQYPLVTSYLASSFESLPLYVGQSAATCDWKGIHVKLNWHLDQKTLFGETETGHQISPDLIRSVLVTLERHSHQLEEKNRELQAKNDALLKSQQQLKETIKTRFVMQESTDAYPIFENNSEPVENSKQILHNLSKISDYMVRSQQLITMLIAQDRMNPQVKEAMRRVDWESVKTQFPVLIEECRQMLNHKGDHHV